MSQKTGIPKGTRDFTPEEMIKRNYIFDTIRNVFQCYGFAPIETPAMENLTTLFGKYGEEGDKLLFRILNSGDFLKNADNNALEEKHSLKVANDITEKGLRYDLTVPFARFIVQHQNEIQFPFKRYQIQPVWRADKPQKGRYREFYQCDADIIGTNALLNEVELTQIIDQVFNCLSIQVVIKINNRKILAGIAETIGHSDKIVDITVAIDKLEKIGIDKVNQELAMKGLSQQAIDKLQPILQLSGTNSDKIKHLTEILNESATGKNGIQETKTILDYLNELQIKSEIELDLTLARGLNYYTGTIFEVKAKDVKIGSICGGGRYDDLTGIFGLKNISGVGISFGADRIYDVLNTLDLYPKDNLSTTTLLFVNFGEKEERYCLKLLSKIRAQGISAEIYPEAAKMKKQMSYANKKNIPFVALIGENEMKAQEISLKNMKTGEQANCTYSQMIQIITT